MRFSDRFEVFNEWLGNQRKETRYIKRITRLHSLYPNASLDQLRGHTVGTKQLSKKVALPVYRRAWRSLNNKERGFRDTALSVLSEARRSHQSLTGLARLHNILPDKVLHATNAFKKVNGRWRPKRLDRISRVMKINENGKEVFVEVNDSRQATIIGKYHSAIGEFLNTGNVDVLTDFEGRMIKDSSGNYHTLETDPNTIRAINEAREESEFYDIYEVS